MLKAEKCLKNGEELDEMCMVQVITEKLNSLDISHYGNLID